jgi:hypothetical protein
MIGTTVIHCADNANQSSDTITCCHIVAVTGASDVAARARAFVVFVQARPIQALHI